MSHLATWFTPMLRVISRAKGHSVTAASAYRACTRVTDERTGLIHDYRKKRGHVTTFLFGASDASKLWNAAEKLDSRINSTVGRELILPLSHQWTDIQRLKYSKEVAKHLQKEYGVAVQGSIHKTNSGLNYHVHLLFTTRTIEFNGELGKKTRILDDLKTGEVSRLREKVCEIMNAHAKRNGNDWYVYAGKYLDKDSDHIPTVHIPHNASIETKEQLKNRNIQIAEYKQKIVVLNDEKFDLQQQLKFEIVKEIEKEKIKPPKKSESKISMMPNQPQQTILSQAWNLRNNAEKMAEWESRNLVNRQRKIEWEKRLKELEDAAPINWVVLRRTVQSVALFLGVETNECSRLQRVDKAKEQIEKAKSNEKIFLKELTHPDRLADLHEWNTNPSHKAIIEANRCPTPDEIYAKLREQQADAPKPPPELLPQTPELDTTPTSFDTSWSYDGPQMPWDVPPY